MVDAAEKRILEIYPFMTRDEASTAHILQVASEVSAKAGGSAGSGQFSKFVRECVLRAKKRARQEGGKHGREFIETYSDDGDDSF